MATQSFASPADILIADDTPANLQLLSGMLKERGHKVRPVTDGKLVLQAAQAVPPDLILLDINMPGLNGYEVCAQLKRQENTRDIPVIFISALSETMDKVMAFGLGGVDYVTKPFQFEEVDARVACHLNLRRLQLELAARNNDLRQTNADLRRLQELRDNLTNMIVHDLRSPLTGVLGAFELVALEKDALSEGSRRMLEVGLGASRGLLSMINSLLDVSKIEAGELTPHRTENDLVATVHGAIAILSSLREQRQIVVESTADPMRVCYDRDLISRVLENLIGNALKFTTRTGSVRINIAPAPTDHTAVRLSVADDGPGIAPAHHERIFEKFGQVESGSQRRGTGLGLAFCKLAVEAHGGKMWVESELGKGSAFWLELPGLVA